MSVQPPQAPQQTSAMSSGFRATIGVLLALFVVFVVLPCGACMACGGATAILGNSEASRIATEQNELDNSLLEADEPEDPSPSPAIDEDESTPSKK